MHSNRLFITVLLFGGLLATGGCGSSSASNLPPGFYISISNMAYSPLNLNAPPGATVTAINDDGIPHTVTSEATSGAFTPGGVAGVSFDTGSFTGETSFSLPASAPNGTVIPYFCQVHKATMATPNGTITIQVGAQPQPAPGVSSGMGSGGY